MRGIVGQRAYAGTHVVNTHKGPVERPVPAIVEPELQQRALARLEEHRRYSGGRPHREYLLRNLVHCAVHGAACGGVASTPSTADKRYHYYICRKQQRNAYDDRRRKEHPCPRVPAEWLEGEVWADVRRFLINPGEVLERLWEQAVESEEAEELGERLNILQKRLATRQVEKDRYIRQYARGVIETEEELDDYLDGVRTEVQNLHMLVKSVEAELAARKDQSHLAESTEAWPAALSERIPEVEADTPEARAVRRELVQLLVEAVVVGRGEDGETRVWITYRFEPPSIHICGGLDTVYGVQNSQV